MAQRKDVEGEFVSAATKYEIDLIDLFKDRNGLLNAELRVQHAFTVFDKCIPELGQFVRLLQLIRDHLYDAVYSEKYTECGGKVTRLPYFKIIEATEVEAQKRHDVVLSNLDAVTKRLFEKQLEYESLESDLDAAKDEIRFQKKENVTLTRKNEDLSDKVKELETKLIAEEEKADEIIRGLRLKIAEMKHDLEEKQQTIRDLEYYRNGHTDLDKRFSNWPLKLTSRVISGNVLHSKNAHKNEQAGFRSSTNTGRYEAATTLSTALTRQLEELEKQLINDFEKDTTNVKSMLMSRRLILDNLDAGIDAEQEEMTLQAKRAIRFEKSFTGFMTITSRELDLLREHENNMAAIMAARAAKAKQEESKIDPDDPAQDVLPAEPVAEAADNPFIPNEIVLSKFSIIIQVSQDGLHFYDLPVNEPCGMCGLPAVLVCPHHILSRQITIPLTPNTAYLRIIRPTLRSTTAEVIAPSPELRPAIESGKGKTRRASDVSDAVSGVQMAYGRPKPRELTDERSLERFISAVGQRIETKLRASEPRLLSQEQVYAFCEEFIAHLLSVEYTNPHTPASLFENLLIYSETYYHSPNAAHLVISDIAYNLPLGISKGDRYLQIFGLVLNGILDAGMLKYMTLLADAVMTIDWRHPADYWAFACVVYPFLDDEEADVVQMNFTSFTEGRMSAAIVLEYQLFCILRGTELRYQQMFQQLHDMSSGQPSFNEDEFCRAVRDLLPKNTFDLNKTKALFQEAYQSTLFWVNDSSSPGGKPDKSGRYSPPPAGGGITQDFYKDAISTERAAQICCYLDLLVIIATVKDNLWTRVLESRTQNSTIPAEAEKQIDATPMTRSIVKYVDVHKMAVKNTKFKKFKLRANLDFEEEQAKLAKK